MTLGGTGTSRVWINKSVVNEEGNFPQYKLLTPEVCNHDSFPVPIASGSEVDFLDK